MKRVVGLPFVGPSLSLALALSAGGCAVGGFGAIGPVASAPTAVQAPPPVVYGAFLDGPVGLKLASADRDKALAATDDALASGQRRTWKGEHGTFGFIEPGPAPAASADPAVAPAADSVCRPYTSTIFLNGRPQVGHGRGCQGADGSFHVVG